MSRFLALRPTQALPWQPWPSNIHAWPSFLLRLYRQCINKNDDLFVTPHLFNPVQSPVRTRGLLWKPHASPRSALSGATAERCAHWGRRSGEMRAPPSFTASRRGVLERIWPTLTHFAWHGKCPASSGEPCCRAAELRAQQHRDLTDRGTCSPFISIPACSPTSALRDDHGAGVHRRGRGSLSEHAGRGFLLRWQVRFAPYSSAAAITSSSTCLSSCYLPTEAEVVVGGGRLLPACSHMCL